MSVRDRAQVQLSRVVSLAFDCSSIDRLVTAIRAFDSRLTSGLCEGPVDDGVWVSQLLNQDKLAFKEVLGAYVANEPEVDFDRCVSRLASPAHYAVSGGFGLWANKSLLIYSAYQLHGSKTFRRN